MADLVFDKLFTLTAAASNALVTSILARNNAAWTAYKAANSHNIITPLVGGGTGVTKPANNGGIYIWGFWIECNGKKCFLPLYVGMSKINCIDHIINSHLNARGGAYSCFGTKALFGTPRCSDVDCFYKCMELYNNYLIGANKNNIGERMTDFFDSDPCADWLIFFHNRAFFENKISTCATCLPAYHNINKDDQYKAIDKLRTTPPNCTDAIELANKIEIAQIYLAEHFCFTYMDLDTAIKTIAASHPLHKIAREFITTGVYSNGRNDGPGKSLNRRFEKTTKTALANLGIFTMNNAGGPIPYPISVDLTNIQDNLVKIGGSPCGSYGAPLIVTL